MSLYISLILLAIVAGNDMLDYYEVISPANTSHSLELILQIPLRQFLYKFDSVPGRRQMGFIGNEIADVLPESVERISYVVQQKERKGPSVTIPDYPLVDKAVIFMHGVAAVKEAQIIYERLEDHIQDFFDNIYKTFIESLGLIHQQDKNDDWQTSSELRNIRETVLLRMEAIAIAIERENESKDRREANTQFRSEKRNLMRLEQHYLMGNDTIASQNATGMLRVQAANELHTIRNSSQYKDFLEDETERDKEFAEVTASLMKEIDTVAELARFRYEEALKAEKESELVAIKIMKAKDAALREGLENSIQAFMHEISSYSSDLFLRPTTYLLRGVMFLVVLSACLFFYELGSLLRAYLGGKLSIAANFRTEWPSTIGRRGKKDLLSCLSLDGNTAAALRACTEKITLSMKKRLPLQSVILQGQSGSGEY
jgi:hypothetical protein